MVCSRIYSVLLFVFKIIKDGPTQLVPTEHGPSITSLLDSCLHVVLCVRASLGQEGQHFLCLTGILAEYRVSSQRDGL